MRYMQIYEIYRNDLLSSSKTTRCTVTTLSSDAAGRTGRISRKINKKC